MTVSAAARIRTGLILALITAVCFGTSGALARGLIDAGWTPGAAVTVRVWIAALVLLIPAILAMRGQWHLLRRNLGLILLYGAFAVGATQLFYFQAVAVMDVGVALLIEYMSPVAVVLWMWLRHREKPTVRTVLGGLIALVGLAFVLDVFAGFSVNPVGILWALGAMVGSAVYFIISAKQDAALPPMSLAGFGLLVGAIGLTIASVTGILPFEANTADVVYRIGTVPWWIPVLGIGVIAGALAYVFGIVSTRMLGSRLAAFVALSEVIMAVLFGWLLLGQLPSLVQLAGGALILAGVVLVRLGEPEDTATADPSHPVAMPADVIGAGDPEHDVAGLGTHSLTASTHSAEAGSAADARDPEAAS